MVTTNHPPTTASFLSRLMAKISASANDVINFVFSEKDEALLLNPADNNGCDDDEDNKSSTFGSMFNLWTRNVNVGGGVDNQPAVVIYTMPAQKKTRHTYARKHHAESIWSTRYLTVKLQDEYLFLPHGREAKKFRKLFQVPYDLFVRLVEITRERWWPEWTPDKRCNTGKLISSLELKLLRALFVLGHGVCQHAVSTQTNMSEEVHRTFFLSWLSKMSSISKEYIYLPTNDEQFEFVVGEYSEKGLPGCVDSTFILDGTSVPTSSSTCTKERRAFLLLPMTLSALPASSSSPSLLDTPVPEMISTLFAPITPSWICCKEVDDFNQRGGEATVGPNGTHVQFFGVYLICDGGYHWWPCLVSPVKTGNKDSPVMKFSAKLGSVRKDIEGVFGILKKRFRFLKNFNNLHQQSDVDNAMVTCCMLHNMMLEHDGYMDEELAVYPGGVEARSKKKFGNIYSNAWNSASGVWSRGNDDTVDPIMNEEEQDSRYVVHRATWAARWAKVTQALVDHHQFCKGT